MDYMNAVRAALRATAPVVAVPVEGRAPICVKARLFKGALKGVTVHSVTVLANGWLKITGMAGIVRTSSTFAPMERYKALCMISDWSEKERKKRIKIINQGVLSAQEQKALKRKLIESEADSVLKDAQNHVEHIYREAREHVNPPMASVSDEHRDDILIEYSEFRKHRGIRKHGSVIRWKIAQLRAELEKITVLKGKRRERKVTFAKKAADIPKMLLMQRQVKVLEAEFEAVCPSFWHEWEGCSGGGYMESPWIAKRPKAQTYRAKEYWAWQADVEERYDRKELAERLREARANIRALAPPETEEMPIAA